MAKHFKFEKKNKAISSAALRLYEWLVTFIDD